MNLFALRIVNFPILTPFILESGRMREVYDVHVQNIKYHSSLENQHKNVIPTHCILISAF